MKSSGAKSLWTGDNADEEIQAGVFGNYYPYGMRFWR
jgi:hypothetical protein